jgi:methyl-accepting chemotaxis protein
MTNTIVQIMVEVLSILGIATKEIKQGRTSEWLLYKVCYICLKGSEKYVKKLVGRTDMEDALKRLDKLTQEEARMATAQVLKATHTVDERVRGVADTVARVDDRVANVNESVACVDQRVKDVDDNVASVGDRVADVDNKIASVDDRVAGVDNKVTVVIEGTKIAMC